MDEQEKTSKNGEETPPAIPPKIAENPDVEDPRLFSPIQEGDRPAPEKRLEQSEKKAEESSGDSQGGEVSQGGGCGEGQ